MHVLDSSALIDVLRLNDRGKKILSKIGSDKAITTVFSVHELLLYQPFIAPLFDSVEVLDYDKDAAKESSSLELLLSKKGLRLQIIDNFIAGVCISRGATLVTTDKDFLRVPGLKLMHVR